ncbi:MAG: class I SAM-dependent methyltransferase [Deltaproteobacteria bacterium]|nr:class I SAM-dependent methyltransferase [Deltaproteobacteria bacterium]
MASNLCGFWDARVLPALIERACRSHAILEERKRWVPQASGDVLEVGVGSGHNLALYDPARVTSIMGLDPSVPLLDRARARASSALVAVELIEGDAQRLPFAAARFDTVMMTYTLCSIPDPARALREIRRVLRPDGQLVFIEHGRAPDASTYRWQRRLTPVWRRIGGNCHLDRDVKCELDEAGFACADLAADYSEEGPRWLSFTYQGIARVERPASLSAS